MNTYDFEFAEFKLSKEGVHLLRNRFNYKTITYQEIEKAIMKKGTETKNIFLTLTSGFAMIFFACYMIYGVINSFSNPNIHVIPAESIVLPLFPAILGVFYIYISIKKIPILYIESGSKKYKLSLIDAIKINKTDEVRIYLEEKLHHTFIYYLK